MEKKRGMSVVRVLMGVMILSVLALVAVFFMRQSGNSPILNHQPGRQAIAAANPHKQLYQSTMHPWVVQDHPGNCPICGMKLVPMDAEAQAAWEKNHPSA